eukprot:3828208-Pyramimonas_sp.AAC.1
MGSEKFDRTEHGHQLTVQWLARPTVSSMNGGGHRVRTLMGAREMVGANTFCHDIESTFF